jgi:hypothetical protein
MDRSDYTRELEGFVSRSTALLNERVKSGGLPAVSRFGVWLVIVSHVIDRFVEAFSRVKKCSVPGRGLMSLDAATVLAAAAKAGPIVPACLARDKTHVDGFVAAFYYDSEGDLLAWVAANRERYPLRHVRALLANGIGPGLKKKALKDVTAAVDAFYLVPMPDDVARAAALEKGASAVAGGLASLGSALSGGAMT